MRAVVYSSFGDPASVLELGERPTPEPGPGQVRVKMTRSAIHNHDLMTIRGLYGSKPPLPALAGSEAAGIVDALGEGVTNLEVGDRVAAFGLGTWAEYFITLAAAALPLPAAISDEAGCQLMAMPLSALALLEAYATPDFIAQNAANGAVGKTLAKLASKRGQKVVNLVRNAAGVKELADYGVPDAIDTSTSVWRTQVEAAIGEGKIVSAIDSVAGKASGEICSLLAPGGKLVSFGAMSGEPMQVDPGAFIFKQIVLEGFWLGKQNAISAEKRGPMTAEIVKLVADKAIELPVAGVFTLDKAKEAAAASATAARGGKVLFSA